MQTGDDDSPGLEVKTSQLGEHDFRVEADGMSTEISLAVYTKVNTFFLMLIKTSYDKLIA